jgi:pyrroloquinoline quinone biosynthesis protein B
MDLQMISWRRDCVGLLAFCLAGCAVQVQDDALIASTCEIELVVLGAGQDAAAPQFGNPDDPAWQDPSLRLTATSIAVVDHVSEARYLFEATPHITDQLNRLDQIAPPVGGNEGVSGVFLTHAHIGHYAGLMFFGREVAGASGVPVFAMPRMRQFLSTNGPWEQLVALENIVLKDLAERTPVNASEKIRVTPYRVPHRDEYSETVGFVIEAENKSALFLPDIDSWEEWETDYSIRLEEMVSRVDFAFIDATFYDDDELPGRDMSQIPHPRVTESMDLLDQLSDEIKTRVHFIHYNHTNAIRFPESPQSQKVVARGFNIAREGDRHCLARD